MQLLQPLNEPETRNPKPETESLLQKIGISSDEEVVFKVLSGDTGAFEILIRRYTPLLYKIARGYGFNHQDAEDLMQDAHFKAFTALNQLHSSYKSWISRILINKCLYRLNHGYTKYEQANSNMINEDTTPLYNSKNKTEEIAVNRELSKILESSLQQLPINYRTIFVLREIEGFSIAETADLLNITEVNVKVRLSRAKAMLQKNLEKVYSYKELYEFNLVYCDRIVSEVFRKITSSFEFRV